jgi:hypothetical protein
MKRDGDHCQACGEDNLFSGFFDADDLGFPLDIDTPKEQVPEDVRWTTFCNECGAEQ